MFFIRLVSASLLIFRRRALLFQTARKFSGTEGQSFWIAWISPSLDIRMEAAGAQQELLWTRSHPVICQINRGQLIGLSRVDWVWKICQVTVESNSNERQSKLSNKACLSFIILAAGSLPITGFSTILRFWAEDLNPCFWFQILWR